jgi:repressor LexA
MDNERISAAMRAFVLAERRMPGYNEMLRIFDYRSKNSVFNALRMLEEQGYILKEPSGKIAPTAKLAGAVRILGSVQAGLPVDAQQLEGEPVELDQFLAPHPESTFMLQVHGDSMIDAGIHEGDFVLVETHAEAHTHDIVVANVDGEWTLKYFTRDANGPLLLAANRSYLPIRAKHSLHVAGVVRAVVRRYSRP